MRISRVTALLAATAVFATACGGGGDDSSSSLPDETLVLALNGEPGHTITTDATEANSATLLNTLYVGLYKYDTAGALVPVIADGLPVTEDSKTFTIKLKPGFTFHNGEPVDAESFVRAWNHGAYGPNAQGGSTFYSRIEGYAALNPEDPDGEEGPKEAPEPETDEMSGLKAVDESTLEVTLSTPFSGFATMLGYLVFFPMAEACADDIEACKEKPIGNGPFQMTEWAHEQSITLDRWDAYAGQEKPSYKTLKWTIYSGTTLTFPDFQAGLLDIDSVPADQYTTAKETYAEQIIEQPSPGFTYVGLPMYDDWYGKKEVRQALSLAVDRQALIDALFQGRYTPADSFAPPGIIPGAVAGTCGYCTFDVDKAKALLDSVGGWPAGKKMKLWVNSETTGTNEKWIKAFGDQIKANLGIDYEYELLEWVPYLEKVDAHELDGPYRLGWGPDYAYVENYLTPIYGYDGNGPGYESEEFRRLLAEGDAATSQEAAFAKYNEAERILGEDMPVIPMFFSKTATIFSDRLVPESVVVNPILGGVDLVNVDLK